MLLANFDVPTVDHAFVVSEFLLQIAEITHVLEVQSHVRREDAINHQLPHSRIREGFGPVAAKDLRICSTMERFKNRAVVVQLRQGSIEGDQESVVDTGVPNVMSNGRN